MKNFLTIFQIVLSLLLLSAILLQTRGTGLGSSFGQAQEFYRTKRGMEKILFTTTIILVVLFFLSSVVTLLIP